jgi:hypothetical protein
LRFENEANGKNRFNIGVVFEGFTLGIWWKLKAKSMALIQNHGAMDLRHPNYLALMMFLHWVFC